MKRLVSFLSLVVASLFIASCGGGISSTNSYEDYSLNFNIKELRYNNTADIISITLDVNNSSGTQYVNALPFTKSGSDWTIALPALPLGESLTFRARATSTNSTYEAISTNTLINGVNVVNLGLQETSGNYNSIPTLQSVIVDENNSIMSFRIFNFEQKDVSYSIFSSNFVFTPSNGLMSFTSTTEILDINYTGPTTPGIYSNNWFELTNSEGDTFITTFDINIGQNFDLNVTLNLPPNVSSINADDTNGTFTYFMANASDPEGDALSYSWSYSIITGGASVVGSTTSNVLTFENLNTAADQVGLSLTVTDAKGSSTTVSYDINY